MPKSRAKTQANTVRGLVDLLKKDGDEHIEKTNQRLFYASVVTVLIWLFLTGAVLFFSPKESYTLSLKQDRDICSMAFILLLVSNISRLLPLVYKDRVISMNPHRANVNVLNNGFIFAALTVQSVAMFACGMMAFFPTPVFIDPITNAHVYLIRWAEWAPLGFLLTFLSEEIDMPTPENRRIGIIHAVVQGLTISIGLVLPLISDSRIWWTVVVGACSCFSILYGRIYEKQQRLRIIQDAIQGNATEGADADNSTHDSESDYTKMEVYNRVRLSLRSLQECAVLWTLLVILHFAAAFAPLYVPKGHILDTPSLPMIAETLCEVLSKHLHILVVEKVFTAFNEHSQSAHTLERLRRMMGVVWERSSDTIALSIAGAENRICMVSPTFFNLANSSLDEVSPTGEPVALVFEVPVADMEDGKSLGRVYCVDLLDKPVHGKVGEDVKPVPVPSFLSGSIVSLAHLIKDAWEVENGSLLMHDFVTSSSGTGPGLAHCEVTVNKMESSTMVVVIRDITERAKRFEAEKQLAIESTEREKDSQTNRFTRHEVKNGLLSAIGQCDALKDMGNVIGGNENSIAVLTSESEHLREAVDLGQCVSELETTLHEVLDTVLSEAMSRDVIHGVYTPRSEVVDILCILNTTRGEEKRFPVTSTPEILPNFMFDPQLIRFIHRNAISNACKYGRRGGTVSTELKYDSTTNMLSVDIINYPGEHHDKILDLGEQAAKEVFSSGQRLHTAFGSMCKMDDREVSFSSGDGAWIMRKCASILGGDVGITFNAERTIFNLSVPTKQVIETKSDGDSDQDWEIPPCTWGIIIEDSLVQRKLLNRLLSVLGIEKEKRIILGSTAEEVLEFNNIAKDLVESNRDNKFLIIADENLDIVEDGTRRSTISGSLSIERLLRELDPSDEARVLALVRSANDSSEDLATYKGRTHGFLLKAPIRPDRVKGILRPLWIKRFHEVEIAEQSARRGHIRRASLSRSLSRISLSHEQSAPTPSTKSFDDSFCHSTMTISAELMQIVEVLDELIFRKTDYSNSWPSIRDKFQGLKGDMMTLINRSNPRVVAVLDALEDLRATEEPPPDLQSRWKLIRALIVSLV